MGKLAQVIEARFGFHVRAEKPPFAKQISTTPELILKANPDRVSWDIFNLSTTIACYLGHDERVSSLNGYYLDKGGHIGMEWEVDGELVGFPVWAVAASGTPTIFVKGVVGG